MARPKVSIDEKIARAIPVKFSAHQIMKLKERANKEHIALSTLIRKFVLERLNGD